MLEAAYDAIPKAGKDGMRADERAVLFLFGYADGFRGPSSCSRAPG